MQVLIIDNNDSFTYNLVQLVNQINGYRALVRPYRELKPNDLSAYRKIIISPGPGLPADYPQYPDWLDRWAREGLSVLGVCMGHEIIACHYGAQLHRLETVQHGIKRAIRVDNTDPIFNQLGPVTMAGLYHSWVVDEGSLPANLRISARDSDGHIMALAHASQDFRGVQFHPESYMTEEGVLMMQAWLQN